MGTIESAMVEKVKLIVCNDNDEYSKMEELRKLWNDEFNKSEELLKSEDKTIFNLYSLIYANLSPERKIKEMLKVINNQTH